MNKTLVISSICLAMLAVAAFDTAEVLAQAPAPSFAALPAALKVGQNVIVTDDKGIVTTGSVVSVSDHQLEVRGTQRPRSLLGRFFSTGVTWKQYTLTEDSVRRIQHDDSTTNGGLIGGGIGFLLASIGYATEPNGTGAKEAGPEIAGGAFLGYVCGVLIDGRIHRSLYVSQRATASVRPLLGPARVGIAATIRF